MNEHIRPDLAPPPGIYRKQQLDHWAEMLVGIRCDRCLNPAGRMVAVQALCWPCSEDILAPIRAVVLEHKTLEGIGLRDGLDRSVSHGMVTMLVNLYEETPDGQLRVSGETREVTYEDVAYGPGVWDLRCNQCGAGWSGIPNDPCPWCERKLKSLIAEQRQMNERKKEQP